MPVAMVTGASRGIGQATAVALAHAGFDVAIAARTAREGDGRDDGDFAKGTRAIEGSLERTAALVEQAGRRALPISFDLVDRAAVEQSVRTVEAEWGGVDVLVNNAVYHHGSNTLLGDLVASDIDDNITANAIHPLLLVTLVLPHMIERGHGCIVNVVSGAGERDPAAPALAGGWGVLYGMSKAALRRISGVVAVEAGAQGVRCFSVDPGFVKTAVVGALPGFDKLDGFPVDVPAAVIAWLATSPEAAALNGQMIAAQTFAQEHGIR
ncbi:MAG: SDR family oxidoreductase [Acidobacteria bacterium]|nr:SDR family oxidoreductase [Acidobacteriota bacterium]